MKKIAIVTNFNISDKANAALKVTNYLLKFGCKILVSQYSKEKVLAMKNYRGNIYFLPIEKLYDEADLVIALGGDGTILDCAKKMARRGKPILGINLGHLGYMAELEMDELAALSKIIDGDYTIDERAMMDIEVINREGNVKYKSFALNDAVISNGSVSKIINLELYAEDSLVTSYRADGLIVSTPTGSTAYAMSAGGSIADPKVKCKLVTPICPHSFIARQLIFSDETNLKIKNVSVREKSLMLTLDGKTNCELFKDDVVSITKSELTVQLVRVKDCSFYDILSQKMKNNY
ncbi:MAG: NAD(+)/NADH kinase [Clostridia bacterium]|nr:NAD(+)/NADH kinase [Clostridia bacterium]